MKLQLKLKDQLAAGEAQKQLEASDIKILRKLEKMLDDPLVQEREQMREKIRKVKYDK